MDIDGQRKYKAVDVLLRARDGCGNNCTMSSRLKRERDEGLDGRKGRRQEGDSMSSRSRCAETVGEGGLEKCSEWREEISSFCGPSSGRLRERVVIGMRAEEKQARSALLRVRITWVGSF